MLVASPVALLAATSVLLGVSASSNSSSPLHQTTRGEILQRATRTSSRVRRAAVSPGAAPDNVDTIYNKFYSGSGYTENQNNPNNNYMVEYSQYGPQTTTFPGTQSTPTAIQSCADYAQSINYYAFQIYYLNSQDTWTCEAFYEDTNSSPYESNPSYFNVPNSDADPVFGYQFS